MTTRIMQRETVAVALGGGPAKATAVIPDSSQFLGFVISITGFDVGKVFEIQGSLDGTNFFRLDPTAFMLPATHFTASATPSMLQLELYASMPGGLRVVSLLSDLTVDGTVDVMMYNSVINRGAR